MSTVCHLSYFHHELLLYPSVSGQKHVPEPEVYLALTLLHDYWTKVLLPAHLTKIPPVAPLCVR